MPHDDHDADRSGGGSSRAELAVGAVGGVLVLATLVFLLSQALAVRDDDARLRTDVVRVATEAADDEQHVVHFRVTNGGGRTAENVRVVGELTRGGTTVAEVSATIPYVPVGSSRAGALVFDEDPATGDLAVRAASYTRP